MGKNNAGILGQFTGKIGNVVGAVSRGVQTTRVYQPIVNNPKTAKQIQQREFLRQTSEFIKQKCKYELQPLLKKKYYSTTAYAKIVQAGLSLLGGSVMGDESRINHFRTINLVSSNLGYGIDWDLPTGYKSASGTATNDYTLATGETNPGIKYIGLQLPVDFYKSVIDMGVTPYVYIYFMFVNYDGDIFLGVPTENPSMEVMVNEIFAEDISLFRIIDGVVIPTCRPQATSEDTHAQYYFRYTDADAIFDQRDSSLKIVDGKNVALAIQFLMDSLGNVFTSRNMVLNKLS